MVDLECSFLIPLAVQAISFINPQYMNGRGGGVFIQITLFYIIMEYRGISERCVLVGVFTLKIFMLYLIHLDQHLELRVYGRHMAQESEGRTGATHIKSSAN